MADNVDLNLIMNEYEAYYELRFDKKPKIVRKLKDNEESNVKIPSRNPVTEKKSGASSKISTTSTAKESNSQRKASNSSTTEESPEETAGFVLQGTGVSSSADLKKAAVADDTEKLENR